MPGASGGGTLVTMLAPSAPLPSSAPSRRRLGTYVLLGLALGALYVAADLALDVRQSSGDLPAIVDALHRFVDHVLPLATGALLGVGAHYAQLRASVARAEARRADELHARLTRVERDQAVWVVAAATLHEVKNPLHALGLLVEELGTVPAEDHVLSRAIVGRIGEHVQRVRRSVDALRGLADRARPNVTRVDLVAVTRDVVGELSEARGAAHVAVHASGSVSAAADAVHVRIIVENLLANALDAVAGTNRPGQVDVEVRDGGDFAIVRVRDTGPGISDAVRADLFEPLATTKPRGLGLGLPIARALARAMGGDLTVRDGEPTAFELRLPRGAS